MKFLFFFLFPLIGTAQTQTLKYQWRKISGPSQYKIVSPNSSTTSVTNLVTGIYQFELKVTNSLGLSGRDTMILTVRPPEINGYAKAVNKFTLSSK